MSEFEDNNRQMIPQRVVSNEVSRRRLKPSKPQYQLLEVEYDYPYDHCLYIVQEIETKVIRRMPLSTLFKQDNDWMSRFKTSDIQHICLDYAHAYEHRLHTIFKNLSIDRNV